MLLILSMQHLDWSPLEYIRWRYEIGEDREGLDKVDRQVDHSLSRHPIAVKNSLFPDICMSDRNI